VARMGEERKVYKVLVGKPEGKRPLGRPRRRWEDGIRMDLREIGLGGCGLDSTGSGQGPVAGCCECGDEPSGSCATALVTYTELHKNPFYSQSVTCGLTDTADARGRPATSLPTLCDVQNLQQRSKGCDGLPDVLLLRKLRSCVDKTRMHTGHPDVARVRTQLLGQSVHQTWK